jgi:hypothetical protein
MEKLKEKIDILDKVEFLATRFDKKKKIKVVMVVKYVFNSYIL